MRPVPQSSRAEEQALLAAAQGGDEAAFGALVEPHRGELHAHCYRMLGSVHDAEDALQDALLRAWRGLARFEGRSSLRSWLYKIATNTCLDLIGRRPKRVLPLDYGPADRSGRRAPGMPLVETVWIEPYPDEQLGLEDGFAAPEARYEQRESVELAFVAAIQHLPAEPARRADHARGARLLGAARSPSRSTRRPPSVNSALQRARKTVDDKLPERSQQATLRALGDERLREVVERYMDAMERGDVDAVVAMLADDAAWSMPPLASWFRGLERSRLPARSARCRASGAGATCHARANGQAASAPTRWDEREGAYLPFALDVLTLEGDRIAEVTAFIAASDEARTATYFARLPDQPVDPAPMARSSASGCPPGCER